MILEQMDVQTCHSKGFGESIHSERSLPHAIY